MVTPSVRAIREKCESLVVLLSGGQAVPEAAGYMRVRRLTDLVSPDELLAEWTRSRP